MMNYIHYYSIHSEINSSYAKILRRYWVLLSAIRYKMHLSLMAYWCLIEDLLWYWLVKSSHCSNLDLLSVYLLIFNDYYLSELRLSTLMKVSHFPVLMHFVVISVQQICTCILNVYYGIVFNHGLSTQYLADSCHDPI